jgi:hypothetical protein
MAHHGGQEERIYLVPAAGFEPAPESPDALLEEGVVEQRWWTLDELAASAETFAPRRLPQLLRELLEHGPPPEPLDVGV